MEFDALRPNEKCGIIGVACDGPAAPEIYYGLRILQHRGQESAGIATTNGVDPFDLRTGMGLVSQVFDEAKDQDPKTRRYLSLVLGMLGDKESIPRLRAGLDDADAETVKNCLWALGRIGDEGSAGRMMALARHDEPSVRMMAVYVLGSVSDPQARGVLMAALNDPDILVTWNAAFGLARKGDAAGREVLERLLDKAYVDRVTQEMAKNNQAAPVPENLQRYRAAAVTWLAKLDPVGTMPLLEKLSVNETDLVVRNAALQQLNQLKKK